MADAVTPQNEDSGIEASAGPGPQAMPRLVDRLDELARDNETVTIDALVRAVGAQGHAALLLATAGLMVLPVGMVPGIGGALGVIVAAVGIQMLRGDRGIWLPGLIGSRSMQGQTLKTNVARMRPAADWLRRSLKIRFEPLAGGRISLSIIAALLVISGGAMLVIGAIPVAAPLVGLPIAVFALGILARDGLVVGLGYLSVVFCAGALILANALWTG